MATTKQTSEAKLKAELAKLKAENEALKEKAKKSITWKVSTKGAVSVYGLGRFPVTLYKEQWDALHEVIDEVTTFAAERARAGALRLRGQE